MVRNVASGRWWLVVVGCWAISARPALAEEAVKPAERSVAQAAAAPVVTESGSAPVVTESASPPAVTTSEPPKEEKPSPLSFEGLVDTYYSHAFAADPRASSTGRVFDAANATFMLAYAELALKFESDPVG